MHIKLLGEEQKIPWPMSKDTFVTQDTHIMAHFGALIYMSEQCTYREP